MVKFQDFVISGLLFAAVALGSVIFVFDGANEVGIDISNSTAINQTKLNDLLAFVNKTDSTLEGQESGNLDNLADLFRKPIAVANLMGEATSILKDFITNSFQDLAIPPVFGWIIIAIISILIVFLFIALVTGRFV